MNICWYASLAIQAVILIRLARWRAALWWFAGMLAYEMARSAGLMYVRPHGEEAYRLAWILSEPFGAVLIIGSTVESLTRKRCLAISLLILVYVLLTAGIHGDTEGASRQLCDGFMRPHRWSAGR